MSTINNTGRQLLPATFDNFTITGNAQLLTQSDPNWPGSYIASGAPSAFSASLMVDGSTVINPDNYSTSGPLSFSMNLLGQTYTADHGGFWADHPCDCPLHEDAGMSAGTSGGVFFSLEYQTNPPTATTLGAALLQETYRGGSVFFSDSNGLYQLTATTTVTDPPDIQAMGVPEPWGWIGVILFSMAMCGMLAFSTKDNV